MDDFDNIPQFHKNPNFLIMMAVIIFVGLFLVLGVFFYSGRVDEVDIQARKQLIEGVLQSYYIQKGDYPENLTNLVEEKFINQIPKKNGEDFTYTPERDENGKIVEFELE